jgi:hypothetical protein
MKKIYLIAALGVAGTALQAQGLANKGGTLTIKSGTTLVVNGGLVVDSGAVVNDGNLLLTGNLTNNQPMTEAHDGTLILKGGSVQTVNGTEPYLAKHLTIDNVNGVVIENTVRATGTLTFVNGIVEAGDLLKPLIVADGGVVAGVSDVSHVNGYVVKEGTGAFTYPVGDGEGYQPVTADLTDNSAGLAVRYRAADAGTASFTTTGASPIALEAYNNEEYWDIQPVGTATGTVTITWDGYRNPSITTSDSLQVFRVAHKTGAGWVNEGAVASGTMSAGSVTSAVLSSWSPFTLGSIPESALPVTMVSFTAREAEGKAIIEWRTTSEVNASRFEIERSFDAKRFEKIGEVMAKGTSSTELNYSFIDNAFGYLAPVVYYRLRSVDLDDSFSLTRIVSLSHGDRGLNAGIYPNPVRRSSAVIVETDLPQDRISVLNAQGQTLAVPVTRRTQNAVQLNVAGLPGGMYLLRLNTLGGVVTRKFIVE